MIMIEKSNKDQYNIERDFKKYNNLLFDDSIIIDFPIVWKSMKNDVGVVQIKTNPITNKITVIFFALSSFYEFTEEQYLSTLVHEMIHIKNIQEGSYSPLKDRNSHGSYFLKYANKFNHMNLGFKIDKEEDISKLKVDSTKNKRPLYVIVFNPTDMENKINYAIVKDYNKELMMKLFKNRYEEPIDVYKVEALHFMKHHIFRTIDTIRSIYVSREKQFINDVISGELIDKLRK